MELYSAVLRSVKLRSNSNLHSRNTLFWLKRRLKGYCGNGSLGLAWDRMEVCQVVLFNTT